MNLGVWVILRASPVCFLYLKHDRYANFVPTSKHPLFSPSQAYLRLYTRHSLRLYRAPSAEASNEQDVNIDV